MSEAKLRQFAALVAVWSARINLVSKHDIAHIWQRHVEDSLALAPLIPPDVERAVDLGSGAGFPGMVLALATGISFTLIESDKRKAAFLQDAARQLGAPVQVAGKRIEAVKLPPVRLVTARALAPLEALLGMAAPFLTPDGICLFPKGENVDAELAPAHRVWQMKVERFANPARANACILKVSQLLHVGSSG